jgi:hypothetical protein
MQVHISANNEAKKRSTMKNCKTFNGKLQAPLHWLGRCRQQTFPKQVQLVLMNQMNSGRKIGFATTFQIPPNLRTEL